MTNRYIQGFATLAILAALIALTTSGCSSESVEPEGLYDKGMALLDEHQYIQADSTFKQIVDADPTNLEARFGRGLLREKRYEFWDALEYYMTVLDVDPQHVRSLAGLARAKAFLDDPAGALSAERTRDGLVEPSWQDKITLARRQLEAEAWGDVPGTLDEAASLGASEGLVQLVRARLKWKLGLYDEARHHLENGLSSVGGDPLYFREAADALEMYGLVDSAIAVSQKTVESDPPDYVRAREHFFRLLRAGYFDKGRDFIDRFTAPDDTTTVRHAMQMYYYRHTGDIFKAILEGEAMRRLVLSFSAYYNDFENRRMAQPGTASVQDVDYLGSSLIRSKGGETYRQYVFSRLARQYVKYPDPMGVLSRLETSPITHVSDEERSLIFAYLFHNSGQLARFEQVVEEMESEHGDEAKWLTRIGDLMSDRTIKEWARGENYYRRAFDKDANYRPAFDGLLRIHMYRKEYDRALALMKDMRRFLQNDMRLYKTRTECLYLTRKYDDGLKQLTDIIAYFPEDVNFLDTLVTAAQRRGDNDDARKVVELALDHSPDNVDILLLAADYEFDDGDEDRGRELVARTNELEPNYLTAEIMRLRGRFLAGERDAVIDSLMVLADDPNLSLRYDVNYYLSRFLTTVGRDTTRAQNMARMATNCGNNSLESLLNLCWVYLHTGRTDLLIAEGRRASYGFLTEPEPLYFLGLGYYHEKRDGARESLEKAIKLGLHGEHLKKAKETLKEIE